MKTFPSQSTPSMFTESQQFAMIYDARGNGGVAYVQQSREITKTE